MTHANADKRAESETLLKEVFALMEYPAKLEFKDLPDGALGVAVHFDVSPFGSVRCRVNAFALAPRKPDICQ